MTNNGANPQSEPYRSQGVWIYCEAEHILKVEDVLEDWHMRTEVVDQFVCPKKELDISVEVNKLLEIVLCDLVAKVELSGKSRDLNIPRGDV